MPKYQHTFTLARRTPYAAEYETDGARARIDFLDERLVRVAFFPEGARLLPTYSVQPEGGDGPAEGRARLSTAGFPGFAPDTEDGFTFRFCGCTLTFAAQNGLLALHGEKGALIEDRGPLAVNLAGEFGRGQKHYLKRAHGERIYGLGDKTGGVNRSGARYRMECCDAMGYDAEKSDPLYKHIPFYIVQNSAGCAGIFYDTHAPCTFDFGAEISNYTGPYRCFSSDEDALVYYILLGSIQEIVRGFSTLTGGIAFLPKRALLFSGSTMAYTDAPDAYAQLCGFADACAARRFACGGFYLSSGYTSIGAQRYVFHWNNEKIPDPKALSAYFFARGMDIIANIKPVFLTDHPLYETIASNGWFLRYPSGAPALTPFWDGMGSFLDFTNPGAYAFWKEQVTTQLLDYGIAYLWNDNNEYEVLDESVLADCGGHPVPAYLMRPVFSMLMTRASLEAQRAHAAPGTRQLAVTRAGCAGLCRMAGTWTGDNLTAWATLRGNHRMGMSLSLSGVPLYGHDIGGFAGPAPERELFLRWLQHGVLTPRFTIHSWNDDGRATTPWFYEDAADAVRALFALRQRLLPYLYDAMYRAHALGEPILRPLVYAFPEADPESDCFMIGETLLAACVFDPGVTALRVTLPMHAGGWYGADGRWYAGGAAVSLENRAEDLPLLFYKGGGMLVSDARAYLEKGPEKRVYTVYAAERGAAEQTFFADDGESEAYCENDCVRLTLTAEFLPGAVRVRAQNAGRRVETPVLRLVDKLNRPLLTEGCADTAARD